MKCRSCDNLITLQILDLGTTPFSNAYLSENELCNYEKWYPLQLLICDSCWLAQIESSYAPDELFTKDYAYFSSNSTEWLTHSKKFFNDICKTLKLDESSFVIEIASNDGYLLKNFVDANIPCLGVEPTEGTAKIATNNGVPTLVNFFNLELAQKILETHRFASLIVANNLLAHVPDPKEILKGIELILEADGVATFEVPYLVNLINYNQFDTIYHEHFSYFSIYSLDYLFNICGLFIYDIKLIDTHGGSLRVFAKKYSSELKKSNNFTYLYNRELELGVDTFEYYSKFRNVSIDNKNIFLNFLIEKSNERKKVVAYGAAAKGNTLFNYAGIKSNLIFCSFDKSVSKINKYLPGSRIPIYKIDEIYDLKPDYVVIIPWNLEREITKELSFIRDWGGQFVINIPRLRIF
jgi:hypothetical protein